jgi:hemerythrin-like metal-binding protein
MPVATETFRWTQAYSVNISVLDQQHRSLFDVVNQLDQTLRMGRGNAALNPILDRLLEYATVHFAAEESLMKQHDFPGLPTHHTQHEMFRRQITEYLRDHKAGKPGVPVALLFYLQAWLKDHLVKTDKQYSAYLNARGVL